MSVVIPAYNRAALLHRAMTSVRGQSLPAWEAIVVDDASTEDLAAVVERAGDTRFSYVRRGTNGGVAAAQNTGLDRARGRYVVFLHSDDELLPDSLARLSHRLDSLPGDVGGIESGHEEVDGGGVRVAHRPYLDGADAADVLAYRAGVHISKLMLRREVAEALRFDEALRGAEDRDFAIRLLRRTSVAIEREPLVRIERTEIGLRAQPKGAIYEYLVDKYRAEITADPALERSWWFRISRAHAVAGDLGRARVAIRRAIRADPVRARLWPLGVASLIGDRVFARSMRAYRRAVETFGE